MRRVQIHQFEKFMMMISQGVFFYCAVIVFYLFGRACASFQTKNKEEKREEKKKKLRCFAEERARSLLGWCDKVFLCSFLLFVFFVLIYLVANAECSRI
jgi:cell division protein FtsL